MFVEKDFESGEHIVMFDEELVVKENHGVFGTVLHLDGTLASRNFYWRYQGEVAMRAEDVFANRAW